jgi:hypothetical protein
VGGFFKELGRGNIVRPSVNVDYQQETAADRERREYLKLQQQDLLMRQEERREAALQRELERAGIAAAGRAVAPRTRTAELPAEGPPQPPYAWGFPRETRAYQGEATMQEITDLINKDPRLVTDEARGIALNTAARLIGAPPTSVVEPTDIQQERQRREYVNLGYGPAEADLLSQGKATVKVDTPEARREQATINQFHRDLRNRTLLDRDGQPIDPSTPEGMRKTAGAAAQIGLYDIAKFYSGAATDVEKEHGTAVDRLTDKYIKAMQAGDEPAAARYRDMLGKVKTATAKKEDPSIQIYHPPPDENGDLYEVVSFTDKESGEVRTQLKQIGNIGRRREPREPGEPTETKTRRLDAAELRRQIAAKATELKTTLDPRLAAQLTRDIEELTEQLRGLTAHLGGQGTTPGGGPGLPPPAGAPPVPEHLKQYTK